MSTFEQVPIQNETGFGAAEFADNPEPRCPCLLLLDNSGSMAARLSRKSDMTRADAAAGVAIVARGVCESVRVFVFSDNCVEVPPRAGMALRDAIHTAIRMGSTHLGAAVKKVVQMGLVDARKVGIVGHSCGGFDTTFLATHTDLFAAAVAGAPITDLVSNYGNHHWSSGIAETDHIETGQHRMEVPLWEDLAAYIRNSAVFNVQNMKAPLMIEVGDSDGTVTGAAHSSMTARVFSPSPGGRCVDTVQGASGLYQRAAT